MLIAPIICVDFDGTIVEHDYPRIGAFVPGALDTLREWLASGGRIILWTVRDGAELAAAEQLLRENGIALHGVNSDPDEVSTSPKPYCDAYIDDRAIGCPLLRRGPTLNRPCVDWAEVEPVLRMILRSKSGPWHSRSRPAGGAVNE